MVFLLNAILLAAFVALFLGFIPKILEKAGLFKLLGSSAVGIKVANFLGSKEPTDFVRGMCVVLFFLVLGILFFDGITTNAIQYEIHKPAIQAFENCGNDFTAVQVEVGGWVIDCNRGVPSNFNLNFSVSKPPN